jgi:hypothetical protein
MFIYKITVVPLNQVYIGLDTKPAYKLSRWIKHQEEANSRCRTKLHVAMNQHGIENCIIEIVEDGFESIGKLALAEIKYIKQYDSYRNGLNSTPGGDGLGKHNLASLSPDEIAQIRLALSESFSKYNKNIKWANTTLAERKDLTSHLHTAQVYKKKSDTLKRFYEANPDLKKDKGVGIKQWQLENKEQLRETNRINSLKGAAKVSKKIIVEKEDGTMLHFNSKSEFNRSTKMWANTVIKKTKDGSFYNGYRIKDND